MLLTSVQRKTVFAVVVGMLAALLAAVVVDDAHADALPHQPRIFYAITVPPEQLSSVDVTTVVESQGMPFEVELPRSVAVREVSVSTASGATVRVESVTSQVLRVHPEKSESVILSYRLPLRGTIQNPASRPAAPYASVRLGEFLYVAGRDALPGVTGAEPPSLPAALRVVVPDEWDAFAVNLGVLRPGETTLVDDPMDLVLLLGPLTISHHDLADGQLTLVTVGDMPWEPTEAAASIQAIATPLYERSIAGVPRDMTFIHIRYPGALRLNPLITGHVMPPGTIIQWIGTGGLDWWRKYAARDMVGLFVNSTISVAPDASWFSAGLPEYVGLLVLHEAGFMTDDELYQALRTLYTTGVHYTGPTWPSLVLAGVASPRSHAARRVLEFRAPLVVFLLDAELRAASDGSATLMDVWENLAAEQQRRPHNIFHTASLLPPLADFGDLSAFAEEFVFGNRIPPMHFDAVYQRWLGDSD